MRELMKKKDVRVNGIKCGRDDSVHGGDVLEIFADSRHFEVPAEVLYDDGHLLAAVKPQGLPSLPDADGVGADTMEVRMRRVHPEARLCHRLDAATGGVLLAALDETTYEQAFAAFREHGIRKTYRALLCARPPKDDMTLKAYLVKDAKRATVRVTDRPCPGAREIVTRLHLRGAVGDCWDVELEPVTGRTHQLRAHMAHIGCPILGDDKYGDRELNRKLGFMNRLCLWCERMEIPEDSPLENHTGCVFEVSCPDWMEKR